MGYIIAPNPLATDGEFESIDAAIAAIKKYAGLYPNCVKVEKRYRNKLGSDAAYVTFLGEKFNIREPIHEPEPEPEPLISEDETRDIERDSRIRRILKESATPRKTMSYGIYCHYSGDGYCEDFEADESAEIMDRLAGAGLCAKEHPGECCTFATKGLASLVLAWFAHRNESIFFEIRDRLYEVPKSEWCRKMFDKVLDTGRYDEDAGPYYVKALPVKKRGETICSDALDLPSSYHDGIERVRTHNW